MNHEPPPVPFPIKGNNLADPPIVPNRRSSWSKTTATLSLVFGLVALLTVPGFAFMSLMASLQYQNGNGSLLLPILGGLVGLLIHLAAGVAGFVSILNKGPKSRGWAGLVLNALAVLITGITVMLASMS
jgi:hypothetical protein